MLMKHYFKKGTPTLPYKALLTKRNLAASSNTTNQGKNDIKAQSRKKLQFDSATQKQKVRNIKSKSRKWQWTDDSPNVYAEGEDFISIWNRTSTKDSDSKANSTTGSSNEEWLEPLDSSYTPSKEQTSPTDLIHVTVKEEHDAQYPVEIEGKHLSTPLDTGASKSCINYKIYNSLGLTYPICQMF